MNILISIESRNLQEEAEGKHNKLNDREINFFNDISGHFISTLQHFFAEMSRVHDPFMLENFNFFL